MKRFLFILFWLSIPAFLLADETMRVWTSKSGNTFRATFVAGYGNDPETVYLLKEGDLYKIPFKNLSQADQDYVAKARTGKGIEVVSSGRQYALLIGVNKYATPFKSLPYCVQDAELLADCFQKAGISRENIILVTDDSSFERRPTGVNIRRQIEIVTSILDPEDQLIVVFSGHGATVDGKPCLCPSDADVNNKRSFVSCDWIYEQLEQCKASQKAFIIDASRSKTGFNDGNNSGQIQPLDNLSSSGSRGFTLIVSCDKNQQSWEHWELQHGVFAYFMADGLLGAAADESGCVMIHNLFQYASSKTEKFVNKKLNKTQVPILSPGNAMTVFCLARMGSDLDTGKDSSRKVYKINGVEFAFRWCPPGTFIMGSPKDEYVKVVRQADKNNKLDDAHSNQIINLNLEKQHKVTLTQGFWIMETEVTQKQWTAVMGYNPCTYEDDDFPVTEISWEDCQNFCKKCIALGLPVQLPTEAQWEYACRAGTTGPFAGNVEEMAWIAIPQPVGTKKPNAWGLYDMHGNVGEFCQDWFDENYYNLYSNGVAVDPVGPSRGSLHVVRGGMCGYFVWNLRSASRDCDHHGDFVGFRCVMTSKSSKSAPAAP